jgi:hypothetical protein
MARKGETDILKSDFSSNGCRQLIINRQMTGNLPCYQVVKSLEIEDLETFLSLVRNYFGLVIHNDNMQFTSPSVIKSYLIRFTDHLTHALENSTLQAGLKFLGS